MSERERERRERREKGSMREREKGSVRQSDGMREREREMEHLGRVRRVHGALEEGLALVLQPGVEHLEAVVGDVVPEGVGDVLLDLQQALE